MAILRFHPARLFTRAVDGAFGVEELPALLMRPGLYALTGSLRLHQGTSERLLVFSDGVLVGVESTEPAESLAAALTRLADRNDVRVGEALQAARRRGVRVVEVLANVLRDKALAEAARCGQAARVIEGAMVGGAAVAWFERRAHERAQVDLRVFEAIWRAVLALWPEVDRFALGRHVSGTGFRAVDTAQPYLRAAGVPREVATLAAAGGAAGEQGLARLGALVLCGLVQSQAGAFEIEAVGVATGRRRGEPSRPSLHVPLVVEAPPRRRGLAAVALVVLALVISAAIVGREPLNAWWQSEQDLRGVAPPAAGPSAPTQSPAAAASDGVNALLAEAHANLVPERAALAIPIIEQALRLAPDHVAATRSLAIACALAGDAERAAPHFRRYLDLKPDAADAAEVRRWLYAFEARRHPDK